MSADRNFKNKAVEQYAKLLQKYYDSNPDIGMGPWAWSLVDEALDDLELDKSEIDYDDVVHRLVSFKVVF